MKGIVVVLGVVGAVVGGSLFLKQRGISLPAIRLPGRAPTETAMMDTPESSNSGVVLGEQAPPLAISHFADRFAGVGRVIGNLASSLGTQAVKTGETLAKNATTTPSDQSEVIDMSQVVKDISSKVESIPGNLVNQAKIEYCRQVLETATASASPQ